jgi:orotidine-5'-phosphate decarboxylase
MTADSNFADRLIRAIQAKQTPLVVGLDPRTRQLPDPLKPKSDDPEEVAQAYLQFCQSIVDVVAPLVPAVKPQMAFFEQLGPPGMQALWEMIAYCRSKELLVVLDGKRGDIGSTAEAYANAYLGSNGTSVWGADALTVNPWMGRDTLEPFVKTATDRDAGIFVLVRTSNPGSSDFQSPVAAGSAMYEHVANAVEKLAQQTAGTCGYGSVGAVIGATWPEELKKLRDSMPHTIFLVPGFGAQGGTASDVAQAFDRRGLGAIVNSSRGIIFAWEAASRKHLAGARWQEAVEQATFESIAQLREFTPARCLAE